MEIYPAVDVQGGRVARVHSSVYGDDPAAVVARCSAAGARWVHVVDLDAAYGTGSNRELIHALLATAPLRVQVGGALGSEQAIDEMLAWGAARVVIGCAAAAALPELVVRLVRRHGPERLAVAIDTAGDRVMPRGRPVSVVLTPDELARRVRDAGIRAIVHTDVRRDGTLGGPDVAGAVALARHGLAVAVSGGVSSLGDLRAVRDAALAGAIVGRALHEGRFTMAEALACVAP